LDSEELSVRRRIRWPERQKERPALTIEAPVTALRALQGTSQAPPGDRYCLKPPIFRGEGDVYHFICVFENVVTIAKWPAAVRVLQLRACLTDWAKSFALGPNEALRTRFGLMASEASEQLQTMRGDRRTPLEDQVNALHRIVKGILTENIINFSQNVV